MKVLLTERQLKLLKLFLVKKKQLNESKIRKGVELKDAQALGSKKEDKKELETKKPVADKTKLKIDSVATLEKILQVVANHNKGLRVPTKLKSKFEKEVKFSSDIVRDLKTKLEKLIKTTSGVDHNVSEGKKSVFISTKNKTDNTGKLKPASFKADLKKALKVKSLELPLTDVEIDRTVIDSFLKKVSQEYSSNFVFQRAEGGKINLTYGK